MYDLVFVKMCQASQQLDHVPGNLFHRHKLAASSRHVLVQIPFIPIAAKFVLRSKIYHSRKLPTSLPSNEESY